MNEQGKPDMAPWWKSPWVGVIGMIAGVVGVVVGIIGLLLYLGGQRTRELTYYLHPAKTIIVKSGQTSALRVLYEGQEIRSDVTAAQIAVWNNGKEAIEAGDILQTIAIETEGSAPILEARLVPNERLKITGFSKDDSIRLEGRVLLSWRILEHNDGGIVQLTYAGSPQTEIRVTGAVKGQRAILARAKVPRRTRFLAYFNFVLVGALFLVTFLRWRRVLSRRFEFLLPARRGRALVVTNFIIGILYLAYSVTLLYFLNRLPLTATPFEF